jgi:hypothetical protein
MPQATAHLNSLEKSTMYLNAIMELFYKNSLTAPLETASRQIDFSDGDEVRVLMIKTTGLGDYQRDVGYPQGAVEAKWETLKLATDRGTKFLLDRIDNDETLALTMGHMIDNFTKTQMVPELDAFRFSKYANGAGEKANITFSSTTAILPEIDRARVHLNKKNVPLDGRYLFVNQDLEWKLSNELQRMWSNEAAINTMVRSYNGMQIVYVPDSRFQTLIQLKTGDSMDFGYEVDPASKKINFLLMYPGSVVQAAKTNKGKFVSKDEPATMVDSDIFMFRIFHDAFVINPLKDGVYASIEE